MTCIVALEDKGNLYLGGDSAGVAGLSIQIRADEKVFTNGSFLLGFTSSFRMGNILRYKFNPPKQSDKQSDMEYMVCDFVDAVRTCFKNNGYGKIAEGLENEGGIFIVGYNKKIYTVESDFQVAMLYKNYAAVGCGRDIALGSLFSTVGKKPEDRVIKALEAASEFSAGVAKPFVVVKKMVNEKS